MFYIMDRYDTRLAMKTGVDTSSRDMTSTWSYHVRNLGDALHTRPTVLQMISRTFR